MFTSVCVYNRLCVDGALDFYASYSPTTAIIRFLRKVLCSNSERFPPKIAKEFVT